MEDSAIAREIASLPLDARRQVFEFVAFLKTRHPTVQPIKKKKSTKLTNEPFIGMWRDRKNLKDSSAWVRDLRKSEWETGV